MYNNLCTIDIIGVSKLDRGNSDLEKYSRGRRGAPAKGVGRATGARVQIPPSPFSSQVKEGKCIKALPLFLSQANLFFIYNSSNGAKK